MSQRHCRVTLARCPLAILLSFVIAAIASTPVSAQEKTVAFVPRAEMIDAIMHYLALGGCDALGNVFGSGFENACNQRGTSAPVLAFAALHALNDHALIEICRRSKILDCEAPQEASTGRPVLTFETAFDIRAASIAAWSPDGRQLIIYAIDRPKGQMRIIDVEQLKLDAFIAEGAAPSAVAWSPDGKYVALGGHQSEPRGPLTIGLYTSDTLEAKASLAAAKEHQCGVAASQELAFTEDSRALWVNCGGMSRVPSGFPIAIKLGVPGLQIEDRLFPAPLSPDTQSTFQTYTISRRGEDLVLTGISRPATFALSDSEPQMAVQSFSLRTKEPLHPPVLMPLYHDDWNSRSIVNLRSVASAHLAEDQRGVLVRFSGVGSGGSRPSRPEVAELWSTEGRGKVEAGPPDAMLDRHLGPPNRIASSGLHIRVRAIANSSRRTLLVLESRSGDTVQEIGPVSPLNKILVSPDGTRVAVFGRREIRFYRVNP